MNAVLQEQFQRVETALSTLIDSISSYTPSLGAAEALIEADDELTRRLDQLIEHQKNHATLIQLHQTSASLSDEITNALKTLASTRKDLVDAPASVFPDDGRPEVPYDELLAYAKKISKFTIPPTYRAQVPASPVKSSTSPTRGGNGTAGGGGGELPERRRSDVDSEMVNGTTGFKMVVEGTPLKNQGSAISAITDQESQWLDPAKGVSFVPWPSEDVIRRGALARIQVMLDAGEDPSLIRDEQSAAARQQDDENSVKNEPESHRRDDTTPPRVGDSTNQPTGDASRAAANEQKPPTASAAAEPQRVVKEEKPAVFGGLDLYDPEAD